MKTEIALSCAENMLFCDLSNQMLIQTCHNYITYHHIFVYIDNPRDNPCDNPRADEEKECRAKRLKNN